MPTPESTFKGLRLTQRASSSDVFAHAGGTFGLGSASATVQSTTVKLTYELLLQAGQELENGPDNRLRVVNHSVGMRLFVTISDVQADFGLDLAGISAACQLGLASAEVRFFTHGLLSAPEEISAGPTVDLSQPDGLERIMEHIQAIQDWMVDNYHTLEPVEDIEAYQDLAGFDIERALAIVFTMKQISLGHKLSKALTVATRQGVDLGFVQTTYTEMVPTENLQKSPPASVRKEARQWLSRNTQGLDLDDDDAFVEVPRTRDAVSLVNPWED